MAKTIGIMASQGWGNDPKKQRIKLNKIESITLSDCSRDGDRVNFPRYIIRYHYNNKEIPEVHHTLSDALNKMKKLFDTGLFLDTETSSNDMIIRIIAKEHYQDHEISRMKYSISEMIRDKMENMDLQELINFRIQLINFEDDF